jgi:thioredoxin 1
MQALAPGLELFNDRRGAMAGNLVELKTADFEAAIAKGVVLVDFWAPWCGPCRMQTPILEQVAAKAGETARVAKVNVDEERDLAAKHGIRSIPALLVFKDGKVVQQFTGLTRAEPLLAAIDAAGKN